MVLFDVDHTITRHSTGRRFGQQGAAMGLFSPLYLLRAPFFYLRYKLGLVDPQELSAYLSPLRGMTRADVERLGRRCFDERIRDEIYPEARARIHNLKAVGEDVVLVSASVDAVIHPLAEELGLEHVVCTRIEFENDVATGGSSNPVCFGDEKRRQALAFLEQRGVDPADCSFYSDSRQDLPLLSAVGSPVVVNPDPHLRRVARRNDWPLLSFS
ncbi:MAG: HAD family hydrolase [Spirochaetota bacterium]